MPRDGCSPSTTPEKMSQDSRLLYKIKMTEDLSSTQSSEESTISWTEAQPRIDWERELLLTSKDTSVSHPRNGSPSSRRSQASPEHISKSPRDQSKAISDIAPKKILRRSSTELHPAKLVMPVEKLPVPSTPRRWSLQEQTIWMLSILESSCAAIEALCPSETNPDGREPNLSFVRLVLISHHGNRSLKISSGGSHMTDTSIVTSTLSVVQERVLSATGSMPTTVMGEPVYEFEPDQTCFSPRSRSYIRAEAWIWPSSSNPFRFSYWIAHALQPSIFRGPVLKRSRTDIAHPPSTSVSPRDSHDLM